MTYPEFFGGQTGHTSNPQWDIPSPPPGALKIHSLTLSVHRFFVKAFPNYLSLHYKTFFLKDDFLKNHIFKGNIFIAINL